MAWAPPSSPSCDYSGDKLDPSTVDKQPKYLWFLSIIEGQPHLIREIPDHATFRGKGANTASLDKLGLFPSLALCNKTNFGYLQFPKYSVLYKM